MDLVPALAVRLMKRRVLSRPGVYSLLPGRITLLFLMSLLSSYSHLHDRDLDGIHEKRCVQIKGCHHDPDNEDDMKTVRRLFLLSGRA